MSRSTCRPLVGTHPGVLSEPTEDEEPSLPDLRIGLAPSAFRVLVFEREKLGNGCISVWVWYLPSMRIRSNLGRRIGAWAIVGAASLFGIATCGSAGPMSSGESAKSANHIFRDAQTAAGGATSARVSGQVTSVWATNDLGRRCRAGKGRRNPRNEWCEPQLLLAQPNVYIEADQASWQTLTSSSALAGLLANKWLQTTTANSGFADRANLWICRNSPPHSSRRGLSQRARPRRSAGNPPFRLRTAETGAPCMWQMKAPPTFSDSKEVGAILAPLISASTIRRQSHPRLLVLSA